MDHLPQGSQPELISKELHHTHIGESSRHTDPLLQATRLLKATAQEEALTGQVGLRYMRIQLVQSQSIKRITDQQA